MSQHGAREARLRAKLRCQSKCRHHEGTLLFNFHFFAKTLSTVGMANLIAAVKRGAGLQWSQKLMEAVMRWAHRLPDACVFPPAVLERVW